MAFDEEGLGVVVVSFNGTLLTEGRETPVVVNGTNCLFSMTSEAPKATVRER